jgi:uncharacterized protein YndB with AHSA1/START domain
MRVSEASLELLAPRADVWRFVAEPYHLTDWWPGLTGVEPDRLGFVPGARWKAIVRVRNVLLGSRRKETLLLVRAVEPYERFAFHVLATKLDAEVRLHTLAPDRTRVTVTASRGGSSLPRPAVKRLYDLVQTAAAL